MPFFPPSYIKLQNIAMKVSTFNKDINTRLLQIDNKVNISKFIFCAVF